MRCPAIPPTPSQTGRCFGEGGGAPLNTPRGRGVDYAAIHSKITDKKEAAAAREAGAPFGTMSVLVVEDESLTRMVLVKMLGTLGMREMYQAAVASHPST